MRNVIVLVILLLMASVAQAQGQGCLHVMKQLPVFCPKCSDPAAGGGTAAKKISPSLCQSCGFYCWYTLTEEGGKHEFLPMSDMPKAEALIPEASAPGCLPSDAERDQVLSQAIPLALHMKREDFERLAKDSPVAASVIAMMLWRGDSSMTNAREYSVQFKGRPSYEDAIALFENYDKRVAEPWSIPMKDDEFLHVDVIGEEMSDDRVRLTVRALQVSGETRKSAEQPTVIEVNVGTDEVASSFAGQMVVAREAVATYGR